MNVTENYIPKSKVKNLHRTHANMLNNKYQKQWGGTLCRNGVNLKSGLNFRK